MRTVVRGPADSGEALLRRMAARRRRDNIVVAVLAVLAVLGGGHAILSVFDSGPPAPSDDSTTAIVGHAQLAGSFAEQFVVAYLTAVGGQQDRIGEFVGSNQQITLPSSARQVSDPAVVYVSRAVAAGGLEVWSVTVSVRVGKPGAAASDQRQFYRVAVSLTDGRLRALSTPAVVQPPGKGVDLKLAYGAPCAPDTPLGQVASGFLSAMLTGNGDVARYTVPDSGLAALKPSPFTAVELTSLTTDDSSCGSGGAKAQVLATVNPKADTGATATLAYPLTMIRNAGQWQVVSIDPIPALSSPLAVVVGGDARGGAPPTSTTTSSPTVTIPPATQN
ncbi:conjugal transfer protein [Nocardia implantans]|uniref:Conjugal transfer protein n=1 Tax=Nocardia implantans TaxID=3108168 RepID=A0ABU6AQD1_9NOCA|nr:MULTISPECIES: conjugal transfer protein [unclassified Nocardia]MEA3526998.1 conjugal transfer protein [Nocardia sp. CDC192]MEB3509424.1 conjugal transfer protein [Nocardia sp. CDC186]